MTNASVLSGPKILLEGPAGTGKTYSLGSVVDWAQAHSKEVFVLFTENGLESLLGYWTDRGKEVPSCLHWHRVASAPISLKSLISAADSVGKLSYESITKLSDPSRAQNNAFLKTLSDCADFPDDRTEKRFGAVDSWDTSRIFIIDSLSELSNLALKMVIGNKPTASPPDYGVAQTNLLNFLRLCTQDCRCTFILTAHVQRQVDEVAGTTKLMTKAVGRALGDDIPQLFSDVIFTVREGTNFFYDTAAPNVDVKTRNLPIAGKQIPDLGKIMDKWVSRGGK